MSDPEDEMPDKPLKTSESTKPYKPPKPSKPKVEPIEPQDYKCPQCDAIVDIYTSPEATYITIIAGCITVAVLQVWSIFLLPFILALFKAIIVRCGRCDCKLETHQPFGISSLQDKVMTIGCGQCALVLSRSYLLSAVAIILCLLYLFVGGVHSLELSRTYVQSTWKEYLEDCGGEVMIQNSVRVSQTFSAKYEGKSVSWDGFLMRATENQGWFKGDHAVVVLVKMQPSESDIHADLILSMDEHDFLENKKELAALDRGSHFVFNATFMSVGNEQQLHHLHAHYLKKIDGFLEIAPHVHSVNHRYTLKIQTGKQ